jgi:carnitine O-acetyltransferase
VAPKYACSFHASRYPTKPADTAQKFDMSTHNHVVFIRKNKFYAVPLADKNGREIGAAELEVSEFMYCHTYQALLTT